MEITFKTYKGNLETLWKFSDVVASYNNNRANLIIHYMYKGKHYVRSFPYKNVKELTQKYPA